MNQRALQTVQVWRFALEFFPVEMSWFLFWNASNPYVFGVNLVDVVFPKNKPPHSMVLWKEIKTISHPLQNSDVRVYTSAFPSDWATSFKVLVRIFPRSHWFFGNPLNPNTFAWLISCGAIFPLGWNHIRYLMAFIRHMSSITVTDIYYSVVISLVYGWYNETLVNCWMVTCLLSMFCILYSATTCERLVQKRYSILSTEIYLV